MSESLLILGASVRAAAQSAARAGIHPICGDLFADADLPDGIVGQVARRFPGDLARIAEQSSAAPWMYSGGLENHPRLVASISRQRQLLGTSPEALRRVRDPFKLSRALDKAGLRFPECRPTGEGLPHDGSWLRKSRRSSGGLRVTAWRGEHFPDTSGFYYQRRIDGMSASAVYLGAAGRARLLGVTEQVLTGSGALSFQYAGSIGPLDLEPHQQRRIAALGDLLARRFEPRGLFGVDFIITSDDVWTVEVNPRFTASIEVLERTLGFNAISLHVTACEDSRLPEVPISPSGKCSGKLILYAERRRRFSADMLAAISARNRGLTWPTVADIPRAGTQLLAGQPVLTVFAEAPDRAAVKAALQRQIQELRQQIGV